MSSATVNISLAAGLTADVVAQQVGVAALGSVYHQHGIDPTHPVYTVAPEVAAAGNNAATQGRTLGTQLFAASNGGPIVTSITVDGVTGNVTLAAPTAKATNKIVVQPGTSGLPGFTPPAGFKPKTVDPITGKPIDIAATYGGTVPASATAGGLMDKLKRVGGTAVLAIAGTLAAGPPGLLVGALAGAGIDFMRAKAKKG